MPPQKIETSIRWRLAQKTNTNLLKELRQCTKYEGFPTVELACSEYGELNSEKKKKQFIQDFEQLVKIHSVNKLILAILFIFPPFKFLFFSFCLFTHIRSRLNPQVVEDEDKYTVTLKPKRGLSVE